MKRTKEDFRPRKTINLSGYQITLVGDIEAAKKKIPVAKQLATSTSLSNLNELNILENRKTLQDGTKIQFKEVNGVKKLTIYAPPEEVSEKEEHKTEELWARYPVPSFDLYSSAGGEYSTHYRTGFVGIYANPSLQWDNPTYFLTKNNNYPDTRMDQHGKTNRFRIFGENEEIEVYSLELIGYHIDCELPWEIEVYEPNVMRWGEEKLYAWIEDYLFDDSGGEYPLGWQLTAYSPTDAQLRNLTYGNLNALHMYHTCMRAPALAIFEDFYTKSWWTSVRVENWPHTKQWPIDGRSQVWWRNFTSTGWGWVILDETIVVVPKEDGRYEGLSELKSTGDFVTCVSQSTHDTWSDSWIWWDMEAALVIDKEGYANKETWMVILAKAHETTDEFRTADPWIHEPFGGVFPNPTPAWQEITYYAVAHGAWGHIEYPFCWEAGNYWVGNLEEMSAELCEIYDYHGEPVYLWAWTLRGTKHDASEGYYGMIFRGNVYISKAYSGWSHFVGDSAKYGYSDWTASACGVIIKQRIKLY